MSKVFAQVQVPTRALLNFKNRYENVKDAVWSDTTKNQLVVKFTHVDEEKIAFFDRNGTWLKTHIEMEPAQLMYCIRDQIQESYSGYKTEAAYAISTATSLRYFAVITAQVSGEIVQRKLLSYNNKCDFIKEE